MIKPYQLTLGRVLVLIVGILVLATDVSGAADLPPDVGMFLVASENLIDPRFRESVIILVQHDAEGSGGLIINRPSRLKLDEVLGNESALKTITGRLFYGGPVAPNALLALAKVEEQAPQPAERIIDQVYLTGLQELAEWVAEEPSAPAYRVFTGYAGWAPGQLAAELERGDWQVLPADSESIFEEGAAGLWSRLHESRVL